MDRTHLSAVAPARPQKKVNVPGFGRINSYDTGTKLVPEDELAQLHEGEAVVPADQNPHNPDNQRGFGYEAPTHEDHTLTGSPKLSKDNVLVEAKDTSGFGNAAPSLVTLKPYGSQPSAEEVDPGQVKLLPLGPQHTPEDREKSKASQSTGFGSAAAIAAPVAPELAAIQDRKEKSAEKGDLVTLGTALLDEKVTTPKYAGPLASGQKSPNAGEQIPENNLSTDEALYNMPKTPADVKARKEELHARILDAELRGDHTAAGNARVALEELNKFSPWGSAINHPGLLGKVAHVASRIGNIAGDVFAPATMELIPGTDANRAARESAGFGEIGFGNEQDLKNAEAAQKRAAASGKALTPEQMLAQQRYVDSVRLGEISSQLERAPDDPNLLAEQSQIYARSPELYPPERQQKEAPATKAQLDDYVNKVKALHLDGDASGVYANSPAGATQSQLEKRYADAAALRGMNQKDRENAIRDQERRDAAAEHQREYNERRDEKLVNYRDPDGNLVSGTRGEARDAGVLDKDIHGETTPALQEKSRQAFTQYDRMLGNAKDAYDNLGVWENEKDRQLAMKVSKQFWENIDGHGSVPGFLSLAGAENPEYRQQFINSDAYRAMSPDGQVLMQDMFQIWSDAINVVKQETGGVPRGQVFLQKEDAILPHPDKTSRMNRKALSAFTIRMHQDAREFARPSDMDPLQPGIRPEGTVPVRDRNGREIGYATPAQQKAQTYTHW